MNKKRLLILGGTQNLFTLNDNFTDTLAAGSVNGTTALPHGGVRTVIDTNSKLSLASGLAKFATGGTLGDPGLWYPLEERKVGKVIIFRVQFVYRSEMMFGLDANQTGAAAAGNAFYNSSSARLNIYENGSGPIVAYYGSNIYLLAIVMRATGAFYFIKGGDFIDWRLLWAGKLISSNLYPMATSSLNSSFNLDFVRIPKSTITITPIASDAFTRADGVLGTTGGGGSEESGGTGLTWTVQKGTAAISTNKATFSALGDSLGIATIDAGTPDVMVELTASRTGGTSGAVLRYTDVNNYIKCVHDGTNVVLTEVVAGTPNALVTASHSYSPDRRIIVSLKGTLVHTFYDTTLKGDAAGVTTAVTTGNNHGLFTDDTGATFDNFVVWNREGYETLFSKYT